MQARHLDKRLDRVVTVERVRAFVEGPGAKPGKKRAGNGAHSHAGKGNGDLLDKLAAELGASAEGERNFTLNKKAFNAARYRPAIAEQATQDAARQRSPTGEHRRPSGRGMRAASSRRRGGRTATADRGQPTSRAAFDFDFLQSAAEEPTVIAKRITQWVAFTG